MNNRPTEKKKNKIKSPVKFYANLTGELTETLGPGAYNGDSNYFRRNDLIAVKNSGLIKRLYGRI